MGRGRAAGAVVSYDAVDLFAGPGGWDEGARMIGLRTVGLEWDDAACQTAVAAGHPRIRCDVAAYPTEPFQGIPGLIASPPCQAWSMAGKRKGELDRANCHRQADRMAEGDDSTAWTEWEDERSPLVCQPVRWVRDLRPEWVALEEVPAVLGLWEHFARIFRGWGYSAWVGVLNAADYGVPQTRQRVILMASRASVAQPPEPTHSRVGGVADLFGVDRAQWITMAAAIGWGFTHRPSVTVVCGNNGGGPDPLSGGSGGRLAIQRAADEGRWLRRPGAPEGQRGPARSATPAEVGVLQGFPHAYPWQGADVKSRQRQIGNAVPPLLAAHVLSALTGRAMEAAA